MSTNRTGKPRILQVHNFYQQAGGEDAVVAAEYRLLTEHGHYVARYTVHNDGINNLSGPVVALKTLWNRDTTKEIKASIARHAPDLIHAHNTLPLVSPALYYAAAELGVPVVQTLHNYRLLCPAAILYREGKICEDCLHTTPLTGILHACYRNSRPATAAVASMLMIHRALGTWRERVHTYIALTEFGKAKFTEGGIPAGKIVVKPNFLSGDPGVGAGDGGYALFAGRLAPEKGIETLLDAWRKLKRPVPLKIAGDGAFLQQARRRAVDLPDVQVLGACSHEEVLRLIKEASVLVFPSEWYEGLPMVVIEAFACGTPVIASDLPSMDEFVSAGVNGARFKTGSPDNLARCVDRMFGDREALEHMRVSARVSYERRFTADRNYPQLLSIYRGATGQPQQLEETSLPAAGRESKSAESQSSDLKALLYGTRTQ